MGKIALTRCIVYKLLNKLGSLTGIIAQQDNNWESWTLKQLLKHLQKYIDPTIVIHRNSWQPT